jgi:hypothetical protein
LRFRRGRKTGGLSGPSHALVWSGVKKQMGNPLSVASSQTRLTLLAIPCILNKVTRFGNLRGCDSANTTTNDKQTMQLQPHNQPKTIQCHTYSNEKLPCKKFNKCLEEIMKTFYIKK